MLLVSVGQEHIDLLRSTGTLDEIGADNVYRTVREAVAAAQTDTD
jgi:hypothetical protein